MRVSISAEGAHEGHGLKQAWHMIVDNRGLLLDLCGARHSCIDPSSLTDPTIARVDWGATIIGGSLRDAGLITLKDGTKRTFFDFQMLKPYVAIFEQEWTRRKQEQDAFDSQMA